MPLAMDIVDTLDLTKMKPAVISFHTASIQVFEPDPNNAGTSRPKLTKEGVPIYKDVDYVTVRQAGGVDSVIFEAEHWIQTIIPMELNGGRMPGQHAEYYKKAYGRFKEGKELPVEGTPIKLWPVATPAQVALLTSLNIRTVEDLSTLPDDGIRRIGMGGIDLKNKAKAWLAAANDKGKLTEEMVALQRQNGLLEGNLKSMQEQIEELKKMVKVQADIGPVIPQMPSTAKIDISDAFDEPKQRKK